MKASNSLKRKVCDNIVSSASTGLGSEPAFKRAETGMPSAGAAAAAAAVAGSKGWQNGLKTAMRDSSQTLFSDDVCIIIADKYPKARHHYLVMPKHQIDSLTHVTRSDAPMLRHLLTAAESFIVSKNLQLSKFRFGFHAMPSMSQLHMHAISQDFQSPFLKNKKHWLSFTTNFFLDCNLLLLLLESADERDSSGMTAEAKETKNLLIDSGRLSFRGSGPSASLAIDSAWFAALIKAGELRCNQCSRVGKNMPDLKDHLASHASGISRDEI